MKTTRDWRCGRQKRRAHRWGKTKGKIGFHSGKVAIERPRLRGFDGKAQPLPSWEGAMTEDWLGKWAMNQMLITVSTRKFEHSVRLPEGDVPAVQRLWCRNRRLPGILCAVGGATEGMSWRVIFPASGCW